MANLVMVAQSGGAKGKEGEDKRMLGFARAWAKQVYSCSQASCVFPFTSYDALLTKLKASPALQTLAILSHSSGGALLLPGADPRDPQKRITQFISLRKLGLDLGTAHAKFNQIEFLGCNVGRDPIDMWDFLASTDIDVAVAHNFFHVFQPLDVGITSDTTEDTLRDDVLGGDRRGELFRYLLPNTDLAAAAAQTTVQLWVEYFVDDVVRVEASDGEEVHFDVTVDIFERSVMERVRSCKVRSQDPPGTSAAARVGPEVKSVLSRSDAVNLQRQLDAPVPDFTEVRVIH